MVRTKVFVGNLSFTTKENELAKEFEVAGKVISANIITRGPRSLGYGFVEMDNETDAENAVKLLDKKEIDGRPINVEVAKPREEGANTTQSANAQGTARGTRGPRRGRGGKTNMTRTEGQQGTKPTGQTQEGQTQRRQPRRRVAEGEEDNKLRTAQPKKERAPKPQRPRRAEGEPDTRTPSTTTLFVANLPFSVDDEGFSKLLKDSTLSFKSAHVVKKRTGRSKGFGFIEFDAEADQQKALNSLNDKEIEGRKLAVKVALTETQVKTEEGAKTTSSPAPVKTTTTSSPAPTKTSSPNPAVKNTTTSSPVKTSSPAPAKATEKPITPKQEKK